MQSRWMVRMAPVVGLALALAAAWHASAAELPTEIVAVSKTYNNAPFDYHIRLLAERAHFRVYRLTYPSPVVTPLTQNNTIPADYYIPRDIRSGEAGRPAVICLHILDGNEPLTDLVCSTLARRGFPPLRSSCRTMAAVARRRDRTPWLPTQNCSSARSLKRAKTSAAPWTCLASRPEVNPKRIGIVGISLGGIIAASAAGAEPRIHRAGLILAGGDLLPIIHHARETRSRSAR